MEESFESNERIIPLEKSITFNIIYVENTVEILLPFIKTLLANSECRFRLVSNACSEREEALLKDFVKFDIRLSFMSLGVKTILPHHVALNHLLELEASTCFAFMDSDIVAKKPFLTELLKQLENNFAVFTGLPLWHENDEMSMPRDFNIMGGRFVYSHRNMLLGLSYAAIYKTQPLKQFMNASGIDFRKYQWHEIEVEYQERLIELELDKTLYDTAKLLNILWQHENVRLTFYNSEALIHLGGVSGPAARPKFSTYRSLLAKLLPRHLINLLKSRFSNTPKINYGERLNIDRLIKKRRLSEQIAFKYLKGGASDIHDFDLDFLSDEVFNKIETGLKELREITESLHASQLPNVKD